MMNWMTVLILISLSSAAWARNVQCRSTFMPRLNREMIEIVLNDLADMRIQIDLATADGDHSTIIQTLKRNFASKYAELEYHLAGEMNTEQVRALLMERIQNRQGVQLEKEKAEAAARLHHLESITAIVFRGDISKRVSIRYAGHLSKSTFMDNKSFYDERTDTFYYISDRTLMAYSLKDGAIKEVLESNIRIRTFAVTDDAIIAHAEFENIYRIDLRTGLSTIIFDRNSSTTIAKAISPSGNRLGMFNNHGIEFYNIADQSRHGVEFSLWRPDTSVLKNIKNIFASHRNAAVPEFYIDSFNFITDKLILINGSNKQDSTTIIFNIETGETYPTNLSKDEASYFTTNQETGDVLFLGANTIRRINVKDIADIETRSQIYSSGDFLKGSESALRSYVRISEISFISANEIALTTNSGVNMHAETLLVNLDSKSVRQIMRTEREGTKTMGVIYSDQKNNRLFEIGAHLDDRTPTRYSNYFIEIWHRK